MSDMTASAAALKHSNDRRITILLILSGVTIAVVLFGTFFVISTANTAGEVRKSIGLNGCRSAYAADVTDRRTDLDIASSKLRRLNTDTDNAQIRVTADALFNDGRNTPALLKSLDQAGRDEVALTKDVTAAEVALVEANKAYQQAITLSRTDEGLFLTQCKESQ